MYVCICNGYRDAELRALASGGVACALEAYRALGGEPCCGRCLPTAQQIINDTRRSPSNVRAAE